MSTAPKRLRLAAEKDLQDGQTLKFYFERNGKRVEGLLLRFQGQLAAYENLCMHLPLTLDYGDNRFFTEDGQHLICNTHNAIYEPLTGLCIQGPCVEARLRPLAVCIEDGLVWLTI